MNLGNLEQAQLEMKDNWESRRKSPITNRIVGEREAERQETAMRVERLAGAICQLCKTNAAVIAKRTGEVKSCKPCASKASRLRAKYRLSIKESFEKLREHLAQPNICFYCKSKEAEIGTRLGEMLSCRRCTVRGYSLRAKYGIGIRDFYNRMHSQSGKCAICCKVAWWDLVVDHCHDLGHIRGLVCGKCNTLVGMADDDEKILENAAKYLSRNRFSGSWYASSSTVT